MCVCVCVVPVCVCVCVCVFQVPMSGGRRIPVIGDEYVDREFGTGALKITPGECVCVCVCVCMCDEPINEPAMLSAVKG